MKCSENCYISESIDDITLHKIFKKIKNQKVVDGIYYIVLLNTNNKVEILACNEMDRYIKKQTQILIIGIALSKQDSFYLVRKIVDDIYTTTNKCIDFAKYFRVK